MNYKTVIIIGLCSITSILLAENFIVKKTIPKVSQQKLKEHAGNNCADFLHYSAPTIKKIAHVQEFCINELDDLVQNNKKSVLHSASKELLCEWNEKVEKLNKALAQLHNELDEVCTYIHENRLMTKTTLGQKK